MNFTGVRALIVEDDFPIAQLLKIHLTELGLSVDLAADAEIAEQALKRAEYSICLLDWMLPGAQGIDLLHKIRVQNKFLKILMLTAKVDSDSIVAAIEAGADDYLTKPFDYKVLLARVRNLLRRIDFEKNFTAQKIEVQPAEMSMNGLSIHFSKHIISYQGERIHLTPSEFKLISALFKAQGQVLTREQLMAQIQGDDITVTGRTIDTHVFSLRKKLGVWGNQVETIRGIGYRVLICDSVQESDKIKPSEDFEGKEV